MWVFFLIFFSEKMTNLWCEFKSFLFKFLINFQGIGITLSRTTLTQLYRDESTLSTFTDLILNSRLICTVDAQAFNSLNKLKNINLSGNLMSTLPSNLFSGLSKLETLDLSNNKINILDQKFLNGLINLKTIKLGNNPITVTNPAFVKGLCTANALKCTVDISWNVYIFFRRIFILFIFKFEIFILIKLKKNNLYTVKSLKNFPI